MNELDFSSLAKEKVEGSPTGGKKKARFECQCISHENTISEDCTFAIFHGHWSHVKV